MSDFPRSIGPIYVTQLSPIQENHILPQKMHILPHGNAQPPPDRDGSRTVKNAGTCWQQPHARRPGIIVPLRFCPSESESGNHTCQAGASPFSNAKQLTNLPTIFIIKL